MTDSTIRIGLVDDHAIVRSGLRQFLSTQDGLQVVGEAATGSEAIDLVHSTPMDVLLMDLFMPDRGGGDVLASIRARKPGVAVLILSGYPEKHYALQVLRQGARGYIGKDVPPDEIVHAIRVAAAGRLYFSSAVAELMAAGLCPRESRKPHEHLTARELQIMLRLADGKKAAEVGRQLSLSTRTVTTYRNRLLEKMGLRNNHELTYYALKHDLIR